MWVLFVLGNAQNKRGGRVKLQHIVMPLSEYDHAEKGDALYGEFHGSLFYDDANNHKVNLSFIHPLSAVGEGLFNMFIRTMRMRTISISLEIETYFCPF